MVRSNVWLVYGATWRKPQAAREGQMEPGQPRKERGVAGVMGGKDEPRESLPELDRINAGGQWS